MKSCLFILTAAAVTVAHAGAEPPDALEIHRHVVDALQAVHDTFPEPLKKFTEAFPPTALPRKGMIMLAQGNPAPPPPADQFVDPAAIADWANNLAAVTTRATLDGIFPRSTPRKPVIVGGRGDARANAAMEEDLNVMMRILEKSAGGGKDEARPTAGGIELFAFGKSTAPRVFYIDGYGPMFVLNVRFPLLAPPSRDEQTRTNESTNSEWERAREEVYGRGRGPDDNRLNAGAEEFDSGRVEHLKTQLIEDLLNARNIRNLKPDDYVTVVVLGGSSRGAGAGGVMRRQTRGPGQPGGAGGGFGGGGFNMEVRELRGGPADVAAQSTMTLRVKKSDVDKFARDKQAADEGKSSRQVSEIVEEFGKKVSVQIY